MTHITEFGNGIPADSHAHELRQLPDRGWNDEVDGITSIVIVPVLQKGGLHDSGFRCMDFAACHFGTAYCLLSGCSDVIHIGGISGVNRKNWVYLPDDKRLKRVSWSIDCLPHSGLLQLFGDGEISVGGALSSFEVFSEDAYPDKIADENKQ